MLEGNPYEDLPEVVRARLERQGIGAMLPEHGLEHFDAARSSAEPLLAPVFLDRGALRERAGAGTLPAVLRGLVRRRAGRRQAVSLQSRLATLPEGEREAAVLDLVRDRLAEVLGHDSREAVDPSQFFQEMGIDSLGTLELCNVLATSTGLQVPVLALANNPTPAALAHYLFTQLQEPGADDASGARLEPVNGGSPESGGGAKETAFVSLLGRAREQGALGEFVDVLASASRFRRSFEGSGDAGDLPRAVRLAVGPESPSLVLLPSISPASGPHEYVKLARGFEGERQLLTFPLPGFIAGEPLPASVEAAAQLLGEAILRSEAGDGLVLAGHSSGGWIAHAIAGHLEQVGAQPAALVLLDTYSPRAEALHRVLPAVLAGTDDVAGRVEMGIDDVRLTALGGYRRIFDRWEPAELKAPILMVRATEPAWAVPSEEGHRWQAAWEQDHSIVDVPGDHISMMDEHAAGTAEAVRSALPGVLGRKTNDGDRRSDDE